MTQEELEKGYIGRAIGPVVDPFLDWLHGKRWRPIAVLIVLYGLYAAAVFGLPDQRKSSGVSGEGCAPSMTPPAR